MADTTENSVIWSPGDTVGHKPGGQIVSLPLPSDIQSFEYLSTATGTSVANGGAEDMPLVTSTGPGTLFDLTDPAYPAALSDGVYGISIAVHPSEDLTLDGAFDAALTVSRADSNPQIFTSSPPATASQRRPSVTLSIVSFMGEGDSFYVSVFNRDGSTRTFNVADCNIQRIS